MSGPQTNPTEENLTRINEVRERVRAAQKQVMENVRLEDGKVIVIGLTFEDEGELLQKWLQAVADCNSLLCILDGGKPI